MRIAADRGHLRDRSGAAAVSDEPHVFIDVGLQRFELRERSVQSRGGRDVHLILASSISPPTKLPWRSGASERERPSADSASKSWWTPPPPGTAARTIRPSRNPLQPRSMRRPDPWWSASRRSSDRRRPAAPRCHGRARRRRPSCQGAASRRWGCARRRPDRACTAPHRRRDRPACRHRAAPRYGRRARPGRSPRRQRRGCLRRQPSGRSGPRGGGRAVDEGREPLRREEGPDLPSLPGPRMRSWIESPKSAIRTAPRLRARRPYRIWSDRSRRRGNPHRAARRRGDRPRAAQGRRRLGHLVARAAIGVRAEAGAMTVKRLPALPVAGPGCPRTRHRMVDARAAPLRGRRR